MTQRAYLKKMRSLSLFVDIISISILLHLLLLLSASAIYHHEEAVCDFSHLYKSRSSSSSLNRSDGKLISSPRPSHPFPLLFPRLLYIHPMRTGGSYLCTIAMNQSGVTEEEKLAMRRCNCRLSCDKKEENAFMSHVLQRWHTDKKSNTDIPHQNDGVNAKAASEEIITLVSSPSSPSSSSSSSSSSFSSSSSSPTSSSSSSSSSPSPISQSSSIFQTSRSTLLAFEPVWISNADWRFRMRNQSSFWQVLEYQRNSCQSGRDHSDEKDQGTMEQTHQSRRNSGEHGFASRENFNRKRKLHARDRDMEKATTYSSKGGGCGMGVGVVIGGDCIGWAITVRPPLHRFLSSLSKFNILPLCRHLYSSSQSSTISVSAFNFSNISATRSKSDYLNMCIDKMLDNVTEVSLNFTSYLQHRSHSPLARGVSRPLHRFENMEHFLSGEMENYYVDHLVEWRNEGILGETEYVKKGGRRRSKKKGRRRTKRDTVYAFKTMGDEANDSLDLAIAYLSSFLLILDFDSARTESHYFLHHILGWEVPENISVDVTIKSNDQSSSSTTSSSFSSSPLLSSSSLSPYSKSSSELITSKTQALYSMLSESTILKLNQRMEKDIALYHVAKGIIKERYGQMISEPSQ